MANQSKASHDYKRIVIIQGIIVILGLTLQDILSLMGVGSLARNIIQSLFILFGAVYLFLLWDMMRNFIQSKTLVRGVLVLMILMLVIGGMVENPFFSVVAEPRPYLFVIHLVLLLIEVSIITLAIRDIFSGNRKGVSNLWGAASIYLMIGIAFGSLYDFINIAHPGAFGVPLKLGFDSYAESIYHSMCIIGGSGSVYTNPLKLVRNIGVIESVWCNLYLVLLIGRVFGMTDK